MHTPGSHQFSVPPKASAAVWIQVGVLVVVIGWALQAMAPVAIPVVFALLAILVVAPLDQRLKSDLPARLSWIAHVLVMALMLVTLAVFVGALVFAAQQLLDAMPDVSEKLDDVLAAQGAQTGDDTAAARLREILGDASGMFGDWIVNQATTLATATAGITGAFISAVVIVFFIVLLALSELNIWSGKIRALFDGSGQETLQGAVASVTQRLRRFLVVRTVVGALQAGLYVGWLAIFGLDLLLVWGVLTFVLTFIPNLGSIISGVLPVLYALLVTDPATAAMIAAGLLVIEQVIGNYIDPKVLGSQILLSPVVILVGLLFWGWLWGVAGAFLATPLMLSLLVSFNCIPPLRPLALILSNQRDSESLDDALAA